MDVDRNRACNLGFVFGRIVVFTKQKTKKHFFCTRGFLLCLKFGFLCFEAVISW